MITPIASSLQLLSSDNAIPISTSQSSIKNIITPINTSTSDGSVQYPNLIHQEAGQNMAGQQPPRQGQSNSNLFDYQFFAESYSDQPPEVPQSNEPLLNHQENNYLNTFFHGQLGQQSDPSTDFTSLNETLPRDDGNLDFLNNEPPPNLHGIETTTQLPIQTNVSQFTGQLGQQNLDLNFNHGGGNELSLGLNGNDMMGATILSQSMHGQSVHNQQLHAQSAPSFHSPHLASQQAASFHSPIARPQDPITTSMDAIRTTAALAGMSSPLSAGAPVRPPPGPVNHISSLMGSMPRLNTSAPPLPNLPYQVPQTAPPAVTQGGGQNTNPRLYHFGTDGAFGQNGFVTLFDSERHEVREEQLTSELRRLKPINRTPDITRAPSIDLARVNRKRRVSENDEDNTDTYGYPVSSKRLRHDDDDDDNTSPLSPNGSGSHQFSQIRGRGRRASAPVPPQNRPGRRRSSLSGPSSAAARNKRENLNDEQKRQNHIASEQKRRNQIKQGFDELHRLVPELREGGLSKSNVLVETASFMEQLDRSMDGLKERLGRPHHHDNGAV
jgi:Helix-loop-helix DNA-binding domain